jgi:hypothetical protein
MSGGFSSLCIKASVGLLQNQGDPFKTIEGLVKKEELLSIAKTMVEAAALYKVCDILNIKQFDQKNQLMSKEQMVNFAKYNVARVSVGAAMNVALHVIFKLN